MIRRIRTSLSIKRKGTPTKKRESGSCHNIERTSTKIILSNTYETRETAIYKELPRRSTPQEMDTTKQIPVRSLLVLDTKERRTKTSDRLQKTQQNHRHEFDIITSDKRHYGSNSREYCIQ